MCDLFLIRPAAHTFDHIRPVTVCPFRCRDHSRAEPFRGEIFCLLIDIRSYGRRFPFYDHQISLGGVVSVLHPGCLRSLSGIIPQNGNIHIHLSKHPCQFLCGHISGPQDLRRIHGHIYDRGLQTDSHRTSVNDPVDASIHILCHIFRQRRTGSPGEVRTGRCHVTSAEFDQLLRRGMRGKTHRHRIQTSGGLLRNGIRLGQDHSERSRPEGLCRPPGSLGKIRHDSENILQPADVNDQGIVRRSALCRIDFPGRLRVQRISP